jgi:adenine-specific DNA-methyltransferase
MKDSKMQQIEAASPEAQSANLVADNVAQLKALFPELVTEGPNGPAVNVDVLKALVGDATVTDAEEKYGLSWYGKRAARHLALTSTTATLRPCTDDSVEWELTKNLVIEGDNLEVLKLLQKGYARRIKMIFIDPPYNTGTDFVYPDSFQDGVSNYLELTGQAAGHGPTTSNSETSGRYHTNWLSMIYPRLKLAWNLLRHDGVIFITIDDHEVAPLTQICNELFGEENKKGILIWQHSVQPKGYSGTFSVHHNYILCYQRSDDFELKNTERTDEHNKNYSNPDSDPRGPWRSGDVRNALYRPNLVYKITTPSGKTIDPPPNGWRWSKVTVAEKISTGEIVFSPDETRIIRKIYLETLEGRTPETLLFGKDVGTTRDAAAEIKKLFDGEMPFDTPKPTALIRHLLKLAGARSNDIVLDFFAGSGTTAHAVMAHNQDSGDRLRSILVQLPEPLSREDKNQRASAEYCQRIGIRPNIAALTKERLRRAGQAIRAELISETADVGFRAYRLDYSNIRIWRPDRANIQLALLASAEHILEDRSEEDILVELQLKLGLDLCTPHDMRSVAGSRIYAIGMGVVFACLGRTIPDEAIEGVADAILAWKRELFPAGNSSCIVRDSAFANDVAKSNFAAILQQGGLIDFRSI